MAIYENQLKTLFESLRTLGSQPSVAARLIEMGKQPDIEVDDYVGLLEVCQTLSAKLIAFANSSWFSPRFPITTVKRALGMMGVNQARALSISYCLEAMHNQLPIKQEDADAYWQAALFKALTAKKLVACANPLVAEEAFALALLQDMAMAPMASVDPQYTAQLMDPVFDITSQLCYERQKFGVTHAQAGTQLAKSFDLPTIYSDIIGGHHDPFDTNTDVKVDPVKACVNLVSMLPHDMRCWNKLDLEQFDKQLRELFPDHFQSAQALMEAIQNEFAETIQQFGKAGGESIDLAKLLSQATTENARQMTHMAGQMQMMTSNTNLLAAATDEVSHPQEQADLDPLTGMLNHSDFQRHASQRLIQAAGRSASVGLAVFDCNSFQAINDTYGHGGGDEALKAVASRIRAGSRESQDLLGRWGEDKFVVLFIGLHEDQCIIAARRMQTNVTSEPIAFHHQAMDLSIAGGLCWLPQAVRGVAVDDLFHIADKNLQQAKLNNPGGLSVCGTKQRMVA